MNIHYVDVKVGTYNDFRYSNGNIYPVTAYPNGQAFFSIQNHGQNHGWWFNPMNPFIEGIRLTHQPSPWISDYGQLLLLPQSGQFIKEDNKRWTHFSLKTFKMTPASIEGYLSRFEVLFKLAPTNSGAMIKLHYDKDDQKRFNIYGLAGNTTFEVVDAYTLRGTTNAVNHPVDHEITEYFMVKTNHPFQATIDDQAVSLEFSSSDVEVGFITSFISFKQASINYERELLGKSFEEVEDNALKIWDERLSKITVNTDNLDEKKMFYTALYRINLFPRAFHEYDQNNNPFHYNPHLGVVKPGVYYVDNGFWDTFRTNYPFLSLVYPELYKDIIRGYQNYFDENGWYPKWISPNEVSSMTGTLCDVVMAEAVMKGVFDKEEEKHVLNCLIKNATHPSNDYRYGRKVVDNYEELGYIPFNRYPYSTSETLDYCYSDYAISLVAKKVGNDAVYHRFKRRSMFYKNLFDHKTGFLRSKDEEGSFREGFNPFDWGHDYIEGGAWQCAFATLHDFQGLDALYEGRLNDKLDQLFALKPKYNLGYYNHEIHEMGEMVDLGFGQCALSNQPSFHIPFIYAELGDVSKTHALVSKMTKTLFKPTITGYPGDEDNGSMSGWYLFSMMGFYPLNPASGNYVVFGPQVDVTIHLENDLVIRKKDFEGLTLSNRVSFFDLIKGGKLVNYLK